MGKAENMMRRENVKHRETKQNERKVYDRKGKDSNDRV